jgi:hypothetical protein
MCTAQREMAPRIGGRVNKTLIWMEIGIMLYFTGDVVKALSLLPALLLSCLPPWRATLQ